MTRTIFRTCALLSLMLTAPTGLWAACTTPPTGLVSWWPGEGNGNDLAGNNPATVGGGVGFSAGEVGQALRFAGTGAVVVAASGSLNVGLGSGFSIECWIKPNDLSTRGPLLEWMDGSSNGVSFSTSDSLCGDNAVGNLFANILDVSGISHPLYSGLGLLSVSNFQHVALTYDKGTGIGTLYINGTIVAKANLGSFTAQTSFPLYIGQGSAVGVVATYRGLLDEVSLYGRALNQSEIRAIVAAGASGKCRPSGPSIVTQPSSQTTVVGGSASFSVTAGGTPPLSYQWRLEGSPISGATNSVLNLSNVQLSDAGNYSVIVANPVGTVLSSNASLTVSTGGCATVSSGLVSWWPGEGNGNDVAGNNPGTVSGVSYSAGEVGQAFNFSGTNGSVFMPASASLNVGLSNGLTIECWIKPSELSVRHPIVEWNNGGTFGVHFYVSQDWGTGNGGPGDLFANITDTGAGWHPIFTAAGVLNTSNWQHVAVTYDKTSGSGKLYLNGAQVASANLGSFTPQTSYDLYLGRRASPEVVAPFAGLMDEVSVYNRALSQAEIQAIVIAGSLGKCAAGGTAPFITHQPTNQTTVLGGSASFSVGVGGTPVLTYQWRFEGNSIGGATNSVLNLNNVQLSDAGNYSVAISNAFGAVLSSNASLTVSTGGCATVSSGLVSWWPGEGNGNDVAGGNPGTVSGVSYSAGEVGQAFNFNGTNGSVFMPASASLNVGLSNGLTIECWIRPSELSVRHPIVEWNNGSTFGVHFYVSQDWGTGNGGPGDLFANITDTGAGWHPIFTAAGVLNTSNWQHVAVTYDKSSGQGKLYLNGAQVASANLGSFTPQTSYDLYLGRRASPEVVAPFAGLMDEVSVYNRALSQAEIQAIVVAGSQGKCAARGVAPFITTQPTNQTTAVEGSASFNVVAGGTPMLTYQWLFQGSPISGATNSVLNLSNVQLSDAGNYSVAISNAFGAVLSSNASLTVTETVCTNAPAGLVSWWPGEGNGNDVAGNNPGTVSGVSYSAGEVGQAFNFNGTNGSVFMPASASLNVGLSNGLTIECWIKPSELSVRHPIVEWNNGGTFGVHFYVSQDWGTGNGGPGDLFANITDTGAGWHPIFTAAGVLNTSNWQHVAVTYDKTSGLGKLYLNGAQVASANLGSFTPQTSYDLYLGRRASPEVVAPFAGLMDEVSVYNRALSQAEIQAIVIAGSLGKCAAGGTAPFITTQPTSQTVTAGANVTFNVTAGGSAPLSYQWRFEGTNLSGATASSFSLSDVQFSAAGNYSVVVSNRIATVTSSNALLTVTEAVCSNAPAGLVSWWPGEGNGNDVAGSNPGTVSGVSYSAGEVGQAFNFNGTNGSVFMPASASLNVGLSNGLTIECWIKPSDLSVRRPIVEWNNGGTFGVHFYVSQDWFGNGGPGDLFANITDTGAGWHPIFTAAGVLNTSNWQHVAVTYDKTSGLGKLYLNGVQVASANLGSFTPQTSYDLYLGRRASPEAVPPFSGLMDEVSVYNRALSQAEIQSIYSAGNEGKCYPGLSGPMLELPSGTMLMPEAVADGLQVSFKGIPGQVYEIQRASDLNGPWTTLTTVLVGSNGIGFYADTDAPPSKAFYRNVIR